MRFPIGIGYPILCPFAGLVDRYDTEREGPWRLTGKTALLEQGVHFLPAWKCFDRAAEILVGLFALRGPMRKVRQDMVEIQAVKCE